VRALLDYVVRDVYGAQRAEGDYLKKDIKNFKNPV